MASVMPPVTSTFLASLNNEHNIWGVDVENVKGVVAQSGEQ